MYERLADVGTLKTYKKRIWGVGTKIDAFTAYVLSEWPLM